MRFGLIGYGAWGRHHPPAIKRTPGAELVAIAVPSEASAGQARLDHPDVTVYTDYHDLLRDARVETVDVVVPNYLHAQVGIDALTAGKHVLLEKPMAINREECDRLIAARDKNHRLLSIAHDYRASKQYIMIKELIDQGEIGKPMYISINLFRNRFREGSGGWRFKAENVGSWILEEPVHFFDLILWYMECHGNPATILAFGNSNDRESGLYENFTCIVRYPGAPYAVITQTLGGFEHHTQVQVVGREGSARTYWSGRMDRTETPSIGFQMRKNGSEFIRGVKECETLELSADSEGSKLQNQMKRVVQAFAQGYAPTSGEEARKRVIICNEAVRSIHEGREIELRF